MLNKELDTALKESPILLEEFEYIKRNNFTIVEINGWNLPEFKTKNIPRKIQDLENPSFLENIVPAQILLHMFNQALGIELTERGAFSSFVCPLDPKLLTQGDGDLDWHSDGWQISELYGSSVEQYLSLIGVVGQRKRPN